MPAQALAKEIALNEKRHVEFLRSALGSQAVPCPLVNLTAFGDAFNTAVAPNTFNPPFSPFNDDLSLLLATFLFEDIGVSAYQGIQTVPCTKALSLEESQSLEALHNM